MVFGFSRKKPFHGGESQFFEILSRQASKTLDGLEALWNFVEKGSKENANLVRFIEREADELRRILIQELDQTFVTPLDREDIYALSGALDDILDLIDSLAQRFVMYNVDQPTPAAQEMAFLILKSCQSLEAAVSLLGGNLEQINRYCVEVNSLENEADRVCREAISRLFDEEKDPIQLIKWKEIYGTLERACDKCEDAVNILESMVLKNA